MASASNPSSAAVHPALFARLIKVEHSVYALPFAYAGAVLAEQRIPSGLVATLFSLMVFMNLVGARIAFGTAMAPKALAGAALGVAGVGLICLPGASMAGGMWAGIVLALVGKFVFLDSLPNGLVWFLPLPLVASRFTQPRTLAPPGLSTYG